MPKTNRRPCCKKCGERTTNTARHVSKHLKQVTGRCRLSCNSCDFEAHDVCLIKSHGIKMHGDGNNYSDRKMESDFERIRAQCFGNNNEGEADENLGAAAVADNGISEMEAENAVEVGDDGEENSDGADDVNDLLDHGNGEAENVDQHEVEAELIADDEMDVAETIEIGLDETELFGGNQFDSSWTPEQLVYHFEMVSRNLGFAEEKVQYIVNLLVEEEIETFMLCSPVSDLPRFVRDCPRAAQVKNELYEVFFAMGGFDHLPQGFD